MPNIKLLKGNILLILLLLLVTKEFFFDLYRGFAFNIIPIDDDYLQYLLYLIGEKEGKLPGSPFYYRIFPVLIVTPFYDFFPLYKFSNLGNDVSIAYLKGMLAFSFVTYMAAIISSIFIYFITKKRFRGGHAISVATMLFSFMLLRHTSIYGIDIISIMMICILIYYIDNKIIFSILLLLSIGFNEKIIFVFFILSWSRFIFNKDRKINTNLLVSNIAIISYFLIVFTISRHGNSELLDPTSYFETFKIAVLRTFTFKGLIMNLLPFIILLLLYLMARNENNQQFSNKSIYFRNSDISVLLSLLIITHILSAVIFNAGRIMMYTFPLYLPLAMLYMNRLLHEK